MRLPQGRQNLKSPYLFAAGILLFGTLPTLPASVGAQVVNGRLFDAETGDPVINGTVALRVDFRTVVATAGADSLGAYSLTAPGPGMYSLLVTGLGYELTSTIQFDVSEEGPTDIDVHLYPEPIEVDSLAVEAERRRIIPHLEQQGFYERMDEGFGEFITPEEIEERNPRHFYDLFRSIPGLQVTTAGEIRRWPQRCRGSTPRIWMDGILVAGKGTGRMVLTQHVSVEEIEAVEVFIGAARVPLQYGGIEGQCIVLIWTKGGF